MAKAPKHKPNLFIHNNNNNKKNDVRFSSSSALVLNSLFGRYNPALVNNNAPTLTPTPSPSVRPELEIGMQPTFGREPAKQHEFFNVPNLGNSAEGMGDLFAGLAAGAFSDDAASQEGPRHDLTKPRQPNPSALFSPNNPLAPRPAPNKQQMDFDKLKAEQAKKRYEEESRGRSRKQFGR